MQFDWNYYLMKCSYGVEGKFCLISLIRSQGERAT